MKVGRMKNQSPVITEKAVPTVLIVDDTPANIGVIAETLEAQGYRVLVAEDGEEGLKRAEFVQPDLILLDVMMPGMDGLEVCRTLKKQINTRDIPVIFMTARTETADIVSGFRAGGVDYVTKPLQVDEGLARIKTQLELSLLQKRLETQNAQLQRYREQLEQLVAERTTELGVSKQHLREETQERKRTQERLTLVDFALNQTSEAVYLSNEEHYFVYANAEASRMLGYSREELLSMSILDIDPDVSQEVLGQIVRGSDLPGSSTFERRHKAKDGRIFPVEITVAVFEYQGKILAVSMVRDITERKQTEAELHLRAQEFRAMIENSPDSIVRYDTQGRRIYVNPALQANFGFPNAEILGKTSEYKSPLVDVPAYMQRVLKVLKTGCEERMEISWVTPQGVERWGDVRLSPEFGKDGEVVSLLAASRDITERKRMEQDLIQRESELRSVMESSPDTIIRYDSEGRITYLNAKLLEKLKVSAKELIGKKPREVWADGRFDELERAVVRVRETKEDASIVVQRNVGDEIRFQEIRIAPEWSNTGTVVGVIAFGRDITAFRHYEQAIEESRAQLRGLAAKNEKVREEERRYIAREVHDELGQILTGLQLNISVLEHLVKRHSLPLREHLQETKLLMDKALSVARNVATALRPAVLDMGIVSALDWLTGRYSTNTGIQCEVDITDDEIKLDENQAIALFRIVQEALTNVSRHAKASQVDISLAQVADDYVLKIRDNGLGFDISVKKMDSFGVVGMRERALMLDGTVTINSSPGNGTEINVRIPVNKKSEKL
jgi:PAS domain S-box-containing protein